MLVIKFLDKHPKLMVQLSILMSLIYLQLWEFLGIKHLL